MAAKKLTKKDIVQKLSRESHILRKEVCPIVQGVLDTISSALVQGKTVELRNFGVFEVQIRRARVGRNPNRPEKSIMIPKQAVIKFKPGKGLKLQVKEKQH